MRTREEALKALEMWLSNLPVEVHDYIHAEAIKISHGGDAELAMRDDVAEIGRPHQNLESARHWIHYATEDKLLQGLFFELWAKGDRIP